MVVTFVDALVIKTAISAEVEQAFAPQNAPDFQQHGGKLALGQMEQAVE